MYIYIYIYDYNYIINDIIYCIAAAECAPPCRRRPGTTITVYFFV